MNLVDGKPRGPENSPERAEDGENLADRLWATVPESERARLPTDPAANLDHYLYGAPKAEAPMSRAGDVVAEGLLPATERHVALVVEVRAVGPEPKRTALGVPKVAIFVDADFEEQPVHEQLRRLEAEIRNLRVSLFREVDVCANCGRTGQQLVDGRWKHHHNDAASCLAGAVGSTIFAPRSAIEALGYRPRISIDPQIG